MAKPTRYHDQLRFQKRKHFMRKVLFVLAIVLVVCVGLIYGLFFAKLFDVRETNAIGVTTISRDAVTSVVNEELNSEFFGIRRGSNILFLKTSGIVAHLLKQYPELASVVIKKKYFHGLQIEAKERSSTGIWCFTTQEACYYFDVDGILYGRAPNTSGFLLFYVKDERNRDTVLGDKAESENWINALVLARQKLTEYGFQTRELVIPEGSFDEFYALEARGWKVYMSINIDLGAQIKVMTDFLEQKLSPERMVQLQYVDLRIADRIYYK